MDCLFCKIVRGEIPAKLLYQDDYVVAFADLHPQAPTHLLVVPREHISTINEVNQANSALVGHMIWAATRLAKEAKLDEPGYRVVMNCNADGGQAVYHIHCHLLGGRQMTWPPG
ncbi:MAG TPA: histidine triad nucleotide-binding protein [Gammaproteobacteria bacterium]|nr:histidine triad nucleotide-binding protein [Gammaproteobacteria bacterium]